MDIELGGRSICDVNHLSVVLESLSGVCDHVNVVCKYVWSMNV